MSNFTGVVEKLYANQTKVGTTYAFIVDGQRYGTYKTKPACSEGDYISFDAEKKGDFWNADPKSIKKAEGGPVKAAPTQASPSYATKQDDRQDSIIYQSSRKDALQFLDIAVAAGVVDLGTKTAGKKIEALNLFVDKQTQRYFEDVKNLGHEEAEAAPKATKAVKVVKEPEPVEEEEEINDDIPF